MRKQLRDVKVKLFCASQKWKKNRFAAKSWKIGHCGTKRDFLPFSRKWKICCSMTYERCRRSLPRWSSRDFGNSLRVSHFHECFCDGFNTRSSCARLAAFLGHFCLHFPCSTLSKHPEFACTTHWSARPSVGEQIFTIIIRAILIGGIMRNRCRGDVIVE